ncbi:MAG: rhodanese-like domain-containing protein, partial [Candidatus Methylomirabilales bacterium]
KALMNSGKSYALFDVRERGEYNAQQIFTATSLPRGEIEFRLLSLVPAHNVPVVAYDEGGERAFLAAATMERLGYEKVFVLQGGLSAWSGAGYLTVSGVNVPSKAFGERVHSKTKVPEITPEELQAMRGKKRDLTILDVRTPEEYQRFCIPGAINVPGGDLIHWAEALREKPDGTVVVNCAGRTRSIIGTAALRRLGLTNVCALRNGTMGWTLAGLDLEHNPTRETPMPSPESSKQAGLLAQRVEVEEGIPLISVPELLNLRNEAELKVLYLIDVRSEGEYAAGHIPGFMNIPGGQAVQRTDDYIAVRGGQIIFISHGQSRAVMAAYWYRQMGFKKVAVLKGGIRSWAERGQTLVTGISAEEPVGLKEARKSARLIEPATLARQLRLNPTVILDVGSSSSFEVSHLPGAFWVSRGLLEPKVPTAFPDRRKPITVTCANGHHSVLAASSMGELGYEQVSVLDGGVRAWSAAGYLTEEGLGGCLIQPSDVVVSPSITGDKAAMKRYLAWEVELTGSLEE